MPLLLAESPNAKMQDLLFELVFMLSGRVLKCTQVDLVEIDANPSFHMLENFLLNRKSWLIQTS